MTTQINYDDLEEHDIDGVEPSLKAIGYELGASQMRPNVWSYEAGESNQPHYHEQQEELYVLIDGRVTVVVDESEYELADGDVLLVPPEATRQVRAQEQSTLLVIGAPNASDDAVITE